MPKISAVILAAGKGTRMKSNKPKVMHEICCRPIIDYVSETAQSLNPYSMSVISSNEYGTLNNHIENYTHKTNILFQKERLGTGHAIKIFLDSEFNNEDIIIVLYGDTPFIKASTIENMIGLINDKTALCILGFESENPQGYGRLITENDNLLSIVEEKEADSETKKINFCNSGIMVLNGKYAKEIINKIDNNNSKKEYYLTEAVKIANDMNLTCKTVRTDEAEVMGINSQSELAAAEAVMQSKLRQKFLDNGVSMIAPETVYFSPECEIDAGTVIEPNVFFSGKVIIGKNCRIRANSYLENCEIENECIIGPYARVRPQTKISENCNIGNFVEIKKSKISSGTKINHLSYIGDSTIGKSVNIGAGTITCNYDGKNKYKTEIGDNCFIGSNSCLIAPVKIGKNAIVGAGTTLFKDAPENKTSINKKEIVSFDKK